MNVIVVNGKDEVIGSKSDTELARDDIYRVSALVLFNSQGQILLAKRALNKSHDPGKWAVSAAGTVEEGEDYDSSIMKEAEEELGLKDLKLEKGPKLFVDRDWKYFCQFYKTHLDKPAEDLVIQKDEVAEVKWFNKNELFDAFREHPENFVGSLAHWKDFLEPMLD